LLLVELRIISGRESFSLTLMDRPQDFGHLQLAMVERIPLEADVALADISHKGAFPHV
jgi:hypothetical protein